MMNLFPSQGPLSRTALPRGSRFQMEKKTGGILINMDFVPEYWPLQKPVIIEQINEDSIRRLFRITTGTQQYVLKGFPGETAETTIKSNAAAHLILGNDNGMAPAIYPTRTGEYYIRHRGYWFYLMEFIEGRQMEETVDDEYRIGRLAKKLHDLNVHDYHKIQNL